MYGLEGRYVHALFLAACMKRSLEKVEEEPKDTEVIDSY